MSKKIKKSFGSIARKTINRASDRSAKKPTLRPITHTWVVAHFKSPLYVYSTHIINNDFLVQIDQEITRLVALLKVRFPGYQQSLQVLVFVHRREISGGAVVSSYPELRNLVEELTEAVNRVEFNWKQEEDTRRWLQEAIDHPYDGYWEAEADRLGYES